MSIKDWAWRGVLALIGCLLTAYVYEEVIGGGALGWMVGGAILGATCMPLFNALFARNARIHADQQAKKTAGRDRS